MMDKCKCLVFPPQQAMFILILLGYVFVPVYMGKCQLMHDVILSGQFSLLGILPNSQRCLYYAGISSTEVRRAADSCVPFRSSPSSLRVYQDFGTFDLIRLLK